MEIICDMPAFIESRAKALEVEAARVPLYGAEGYTKACLGWLQLGLAWADRKKELHLVATLEEIINRVSSEGGN